MSHKTSQPKRRTRFTKTFLYAFLSLSFLLLAGCGKTFLYSGLKEKEVNEMMALLKEKNIYCEKGAGKEENTWDISVENNRFGEAVTILNGKGYPQSQYTNLGEVFKKSGLVSSPTEERIRFMYALSESIAQTLTLIQGVINARVHIVLPENDPYSDKITPSSASVFINYLSDVNIEDFAKEIKLLVVNSIEGLSYDKVTLALFPVDSIEDTASKENFVKIFSMRIAEDSIGKFWFLIGGLLLFLVLSLGLLGFEFWRHKK